MFSIIFDPKIFNYIIMALYIINAIQWWIRGSKGDACYWLSAFAITASVTFGFKR
jgi:hypothetical protein